MTRQMTRTAIGFGLGILWVSGCAPQREGLRDSSGTEQATPIGSIVSEQQVGWPAEDPEEAAGAIIDRIAEALRIEGDSGGGPEMPLIVEERSDRLLVVRFDVEDRCEGSAADPDAAFRYTWTATPATGEVIVRAESMYLGTGSVGELQCLEENLYKNMPSMVLFGIMMAPK